MFLQIHALTSYPATLLNRDDRGFAKTIVIGGATRTRVSSQCQKRHWREALIARGNFPTAVRSKLVLEEMVLPEAVRLGADPAAARLVLAGVLDAMLTRSAKADAAGAGDEAEDGEGGGDAEADGADKPARGKRGKRAAAADAEGGQTKAGVPAGPSLVTPQMLFLGRGEVQALAAAVARALKDNAGDPRAAGKALISGRGRQANLALLLGVDDPVAAGVEAALFGRFVTSDVLSNMDAAAKVVNAFTVHAAQPTIDYFSAVDDLAASRGTGSGHIDVQWLSAGIFYSYVCVDVPQLVMNLTGCARHDWASADTTLARSALAALIEVICTESVGAKRGATAPYARASFVLLEAGRGANRTLADAFLRPLDLEAVEHPMQGAADAMARELAGLDGMYGASERRFVAATFKAPAMGGTQAESLAAAVQSALTEVFESGVAKEAA